MTEACPHLVCGQLVLERPRQRVAEARVGEGLRDEGRGRALLGGRHAEREDEEGAVARRYLLGDADALKGAVHENGEPVAEGLVGLKRGAR